MFQRRICAEFYINRNNPMLWAQPLIEAATEDFLRYYLKLPLFSNAKGLLTIKKLINNLVSNSTWLKLVVHY